MTHEEAIRRARALAEERGWDWRDPVRVTETRRFVLFGRKRVTVWSNAHSRGANVVVELDAEAGDVLRAAWLAR
jgi:hypothetical protein